MRPLKIVLNNFLPYEGEVVLDLSEVQTATVVGPNGAGKSSLMIDAPLFALFGKARKRPEALINDLSDSMEVGLTFEHNRSIYTAKRAITRGKREVLKLECDGKDISERLLTQTQLKLDQILGVSYNLLLSTAVAGQEEINRLSVMTPGDREKVLSEMLGIEQWEAKKQKVNKVLNQYENLDKDIKTREDQLVILNFGVAECEKGIKELKVKWGVLQEKKLVKVKAYSILQENYEKYQLYLRVMDIRDRLADDLEKIPPGSKKQILKDIEENTSLINDIDESTKLVQEPLEGISKTLVKVNQLLNLEPQTKILESVPCVGLDIHDKCQLLSHALTTKKAIDEFMKHEIMSLSEFQVALTTTKEGAEEKIKFLIESKNTLEQELYELKYKLKEQERAGELEAEISQKEKEIEDLEGVPEVNREKFIAAQKELNGIEDELKAVEVGLARKDAELVYSTKELKKLTAELNEYQKISKNLANYRLLAQAYGDIPSLLFESAIPVIEGYTNEILARIFPSERVELRSFRETKGGTLQKALDVVGTGQRDFDNLSGSEKLRQSLALRIALARYIKEQNNLDISFMVIDEGGFGQLDEFNIEPMKTMLGDMSKLFNLFVVVTHMAELKDCLGTQIVVNNNGKGEKLTIN